MLDILIVEGDPVISLDIADTALTLDPGARVRIFDDPAKVRAERCTHAFLRAGAGADVVPLALRLAQGEARVFLLGAERLPDALDEFLNTAFLRDAKCACPNVAAKSLGRKCAAKDHFFGILGNVDKASAPGQFFLAKFAGIDIASRIDLGHA